MEISSKFGGEQWKHDANNMIGPIIRLESLDFQWDMKKRVRSFASFFFFFSGGVKQITYVSCIKDSESESEHYYYYYYNY